VSANINQTPGFIKPLKMDLTEGSETSGNINQTPGFIKPLKMDLTEGSETSANLNQTPGKHPKVDTLCLSLCSETAEAYLIVDVHVAGEGIIMFAVIRVFDWIHMHIVTLWCNSPCEQTNKQTNFKYLTNLFWFLNPLLYSAICLEVKKLRDLSACCLCNIFLAMKRL
jgi:hypothetical protein